jgi:hypothetical protein
MVHEYDPEPPDADKEAEYGAAKFAWGNEEVDTVTVELLFPTPGTATAPTQLNSAWNHAIVCVSIPHFSETALMIAADVPVPETTMPT